MQTSVCLQRLMEGQGSKLNYLSLNIHDTPLPTPVTHSDGVCVSSPPPPSFWQSCGWSSAPSSEGTDSPDCVIERRSIQLNVCSTAHSGASTACKFSTKPLDRRSDKKTTTQLAIKTRHPWNQPPRFAITHARFYFESHSWPHGRRTQNKTWGRKELLRLMVWWGAPHRSSLSAAHPCLSLLMDGAEAKAWHSPDVSFQVFTLILHSNRRAVMDGLHLSHMQRGLPPWFIQKQTHTRHNTYWDPNPLITRILFLSTSRQLALTFSVWLFFFLLPSFFSALLFFVWSFLEDAFCICSKNTRGWQRKREARNGETRRVWGNFFFGTNQHTNQILLLPSGSAALWIWMEYGGGEPPAESLLSDDKGLVGWEAPASSARRGPSDLHSAGWTAAQAERCCKRVKRSWQEFPARMLIALGLMMIEMERSEHFNN